MMYKELEDIFKILKEENKIEDDEFNNFIEEIIVNINFDITSLSYTELLNKLRLLARDILKDKVNDNLLSKLSYNYKEEDILTIYMRDVIPYDVLTDEEEVKLFLKIKTAKNKKEIINKIAKHNLKLVIAIAKQYKVRGLDLIDLIQEGNIGLLKAITKFDVTKGNKFSTYAIWWIRQAIIKSIQTKSRLIRIPGYVYDQYYQLKDAKKILMSENNIVPSAMELSDYTGIPFEKVEEILCLFLEATSLDNPITNHEDSCLVDIIEDKNGPSLESKVIDKIYKNELYMALETLNPNEKYVIIKRFGLDGNDSKTLEEISNVLNISKERIRQIEVKALEKLKKTSYLNEHKTKILKK